MFSFLASQHRDLPEIVGPFEEEDDEIPLKPSRYVDCILLFLERKQVLNLPDDV